MSKRFIPPKKLKNSHGGFTLLELMISSVILAFIMIILVGMADGASRIWRDGGRRREASREARAGLEMITEDLHSAVITTNPTTFQITKDIEGESGSRLFFLVSYPGEKRSISNEGDLCATGYFIAADPLEPGMRNLYRFHASGSLVAKSFKKDRLKELYATASPKNTATTELIARHIEQLEVRPVDNASSSDLLMISVSAIGGETALILASSPKDSSKERNQRLLRQHLQRFSTIVRLPPLRELPSGP